MEFGVCTDKRTWDALVRTSPEGNIFCQSRFLDALADDYELPVVSEGGRITMGAITMLREGRPLPAPYPLTMYQGVLSCAESGQMPIHRRSRWLLDRVEFLIAGMARRHRRISLCLSHRFEDIRGFQWFNYHTPARGTFAVQVGYTATVRLDAPGGFDAFLAQVRSVRRQEYRRALEQGLKVESSEDVELLSSLHATTFLRQGISRPPEEVTLLRRISAAALRERFGQMLVCRTAAGEPASATLFLHDERCAYYYVGANDPQFRRTGSGTFLVAENIRRAFEQRLESIDFVGINSPRRGDFKTSFNARPAPYYILDYVAGEED